jgi:hypothetical protein
MNLLQSISPVPSLSSSVSSTDSCFDPALSASSLTYDTFSTVNTHCEINEPIPDLTCQSAPLASLPSAPPVSRSRKASENIITHHLVQNTQSLHFDSDDGDSESDDTSTSSLTDSDDPQEEWAVSPESYSEYVMRQERLKSFFEKKQLDRMNKLPHRIPNKRPSTLTMKLRQATQNKESKRKNSPSLNAQRNAPLMSESLWRNVMWEREFAQSRLYTVKNRTELASDHDKQSSIIFEIDDHW